MAAEGVLCFWGGGGGGEGGVGVGLVVSFSDPHTAVVDGLHHRYAYAGDEAIKACILQHVVE